MSGLSLEMSVVTPPPFDVIATGLRFPEGPVALSGGDVLVSEIRDGAIARVTPNGAVTRVAHPGGEPAGLAIGPDGALYVCNTGGPIEWGEHNGTTYPGEPTAAWQPGCIQRIDLANMAVTTAFPPAGDVAFRSPNDLVFHAGGRLWFTDHGIRRARWSDRTGVWTVDPGSKNAREAVFPLDAPNGIALSPDERRLFVVETHRRRVWAWELDDSGDLVEGRRPNLVASIGGKQLLDSMAVDAEGYLIVGTVGDGGLTVVAPDGLVTKVPLDDPFVTNVCFGGPDDTTLYITCSGQGRLLAMRWPRPGLRPAFAGRAI